MWSSYFGRNNPTEIRRSIFLKFVLLFFIFLIIIIIIIIINYSAPSDITYDTPIDISYSNLQYIQVFNVINKVRSTAAST